MDAWWRELTDAGYASDGAPGPRPAYGPDYYGAFVLDPAGNSVEAVNNGPRRQPGVIDHLWLRTRSLEDASRFYEAVCPAVDHTVERYDGRTQIRGSGATFSIVAGPPTENLHLAFEAPDRKTVDDFHRPASRRATPRTASPASGRSTTRATSAPSCSIPTATTSRPSSTTARRATAGYVASVRRLRRSRMSSNSQPTTKPNAIASSSTTKSDAVVLKKTKLTSTEWRFARTTIST